MAIDFPAYGQQRASNEFKKQGIIVTYDHSKCMFVTTIWRPFKKDWRLLEAFMALPYEPNHKADIGKKKGSVIGSLTQILWK